MGSSVGLVQGVTRSGLVCDSRYGMASEGQEPFSRRALAVHYDESSLYLQKGLSCRTDPSKLVLNYFQPYMSISFCTDLSKHAWNCLELHRSIFCL